MTVSLKHAFTSAKADGSDSSLVQPSNWNAEHTLTQATGKLLGRSTAGDGATEEIAVGTGLSLSGGTLSASGGLPLQLPIQDGRYYFSAVMSPGVLSQTDMESDGDKLFAVPFFNGHTKTWTRIGIESGGDGAEGKCRLGIYSAGSDGMPDALLGGGDELTLSGSASDPVEDTISVELQANALVWLVFLGDPTGGSAATFATVVTVEGVGGNEWIRVMMFGHSSSEFGDTVNYPLGVYKDQSYGALPATFGAIDGYEFSKVPNIWLRTGV